MVLLVLPVLLDPRHVAPPVSVDLDRDRLEWILLAPSTGCLVPDITQRTPPCSARPDITRGGLKLGIWL